jgi:uncharacterized protein (TIGR02453 family)
MTPPRFSPALFRFLRELAEDNTSEWFQANKARFEAEVREPLLAFIGAFGEPLAGISRHFVANPSRAGGSMFRINRDTRFSRDKSPYKTNVGAQFRHVACTKDVHAPGFYLHLEPGGCFASAGLWHPEPEALKRVRERMVSHPAAWKALRAKGLEVQGESLARVPQGFDAAHPLAEALKLKDFYTVTGFTERQVCAVGFLDVFAEHCREQAPLMKFLAKALELPF